jgi:NAD(P)-dependent dehydrogenase (short-subunit alcohol dehydrogenase family)
LSVSILSLTDKTAIVTGARRGMGSAIALALGEAGANVVVSDVVGGDELDSVADEIRKLGRCSLAIQADTTCKVDVDGMVQRVIDEFGGIDVLVNNAGIFMNVPLVELREEDWDRILNVDLKGYHLCCQAVGKAMVEQKKGCIINIASRNSIKASEGHGAYCAAKAGVAMLTKVLARELGKYNVRVNAVSPGMVRTDLSRPMWSNPKFMKQFVSLVPLGRIAEPSEIASVVLFLASSASSYITGHNILVDGGREA